MSNAVAFVEWNGVKGQSDRYSPAFICFVHETRAAMLPAELAVVMVNAQTGAEAVTDRVWKYAAEVNLPRIVVITPGGPSEGRQQNWASTNDRTAAGEVGAADRAVQLPIVDQHGFHGVVDLVTMKAYLYKPDGDGRGEVGTIPEAIKADAKVAPP